MEGDMPMTELWTFEAISPKGAVDVTGFDVQASDGSIGKIDEASYDAGAGYVVVDTGFWIFGKKRLIPAGTITEIDLDQELVRVAMTKDQVKSAPDYESDLREDVDYRNRHDEYYGTL
jgi:hypothetical protein